MKTKWREEKEKEKERGRTGEGGASVHALLNDCVCVYIVIIIVMVDDRPLFFPFACLSLLCFIQLRCCFAQLSLTLGECFSLCVCCLELSRTKRRDAPCPFHSSPLCCCSPVLPKQCSVEKKRDPPSVSCLHRPVLTYSPTSFLFSLQHVNDRPLGLGWRHHRITHLRHRRQPRCLDRETCAHQ